MAQKGIIINTNEAGHVDASDHAFLFKSIFGDSGILNIGNKLAVTKINNNKIRINSGIYIMGNGVPIKIDDYEDIAVTSGTLGRKRKDAVIAEYIKDGNGEGDDIARIKILTGNYATSNPQLPVLSNTETKLQEIIYSLTIDETTLTIDNTLPKFIKGLGNVATFKYSTEEQRTSEYWINGKNIYCKTIAMGSLNGSTVSKSHSISNFGDLLWAKGFAYSESAGVYISFPRAHKDNKNDGISIECTKTDVTLVVGSFNVFSSAYVILYYTKAVEE